MKSIILIIVLTLIAAACRAEGYHLIQTQVADEVPKHSNFSVKREALALALAQQTDAHDQG
jgi:hypothetical protein